MDILFHYLGDVGWPEGMDIQLVTQAFTGVTSLTLDPGYLSPQLIIALLSKVSEGECPLKELSLAEVFNLAEVPATLLSSAISRLVKVSLTDTRLTTAQVTAVMEAIDRGDSSVEKLTLSGSLPQVLEGGPLNLKPLVHLEEVTLSGDNFLTRQELLDFFSALSPSTKRW